MLRSLEPPFAHDRTPRVGVLLVNLGTPDAATPSAVRRYLAQFLTDPRVIEIPRVGVEADPLRRDPVRAADAVGEEVRGDLDEGRVAAARAQPAAAVAAAGLPRPAAQGRRLSGRPVPGRDRHALRQSQHGQRDRQAARRELREDPRAAAVSRSTRRARRRRRSTRWPRTCITRGALPALRFVETFHADDGYIKALAQNVNDFWMKHGRPDKLVMSFHGVPRRTLELGDPYHCFCQVTARLLARELGLSNDQWVLTFQSRFGKAPWLKPYTVDVLHVARAGRHAARRRVLPGLRRRLPRDAGGDRHRRPRDVPRRPAARSST